MLEIKVMLVEDEDLLRDTLYRILSREIREVHAFSQPSEALTAFDKFVPNIIITDIRMPNMSGLEMISIIKKLYGEMPIIILSAFSESEYFIKAIDLKVDHFLTKPVNVEQLLTKLLDITNKLKIENELKQQKTLLKQYKHIVDISNNITITDKKGIITYVNDKFCELSGYTRNELIGKSHNIVRHPDMPKVFYENLWKTIFSKKVWQGSIKNKRKDGTTFYVETTIAPVLDKNNNIMEFISIKIDISNLILNEKELQNQLITDSLTSLPNRIKLQEDIKEETNATLMIVDINHFKEINLLFGVKLGDEALLYMAKSLKYLGSNLMKSKVYRISGDEFGILQSNNAIESFKEFTNTINSYIQNHPFEYDGISFDIDITCSIAYKNEKTQNLLESAHDALEFAKKSNHSLHIFDQLESKQQEYEENFEWTKKIKHALSDERIKAYFQPIYSVHKQKIMKYEALVRLIDIDGSVISPFFFLNIAKRSRLYNEITKTMIIQGCKTFQHRPEVVTINLSIEDLSDKNTVDFFIQSVEKYSMKGKIVAEVLESESVESFENFREVLLHLHENGISVAIDDFGSGYSNFSYLTNLKIDILKIDGSLVRNVYKDINSRIIVESISMFARELGMETIAEFVSDKDIFENIKNIGIDYVQGYYISEPMPQPFPVETIIDV